MTPRLFIRCVGSALMAVGSTGCGVTWDDVTSREFHVSSLWTPAPPPMTVIEKSSDGYARAKALTKLEESSNAAEREKNVQVLQTAAISDRDPLCRLAAIRTLGRYKDPRASKTLSEVYLGNPGMSAENNALLRQQALTSLQFNSPSEARQLFIQAAKQPGGSLTGAAQRDRTEILDERLTAIRALGKYPQPDSVETLVKLMETEKDVAIRTCAHESLKAATKRDIAPDGKAWREYVATGKEPVRQTPSLLANFKREETPAAPSDSPGVIEKIKTFVRPETLPESMPTPAPVPMTAPVATPAPIQPSPPPRVLPATLPQITPAVPTNPNQVRQPTTAPTVVPAGAYRNTQGELVVPAVQ